MRIGELAMRAGVKPETLNRAELGDASLEAADLEGTDLRGVDLSHVSGLTRAQIVRALIDEQTTLPPDLQPARAAIVHSSRAAHDPKMPPTVSAVASELHAATSRGRNST